MTERTFISWSWHLSERASGIFVPSPWLSPAFPFCLGVPTTFSCAFRSSFGDLFVQIFCPFLMECFVFFY